MALLGYETGALGPGDWERDTRSAAGSRDKPEKPPESDLDGDLIGSKKLSKVIEAAEGGDK